MSLIARRRTERAVARARLEDQGRDGLPWSKSRGQAIACRSHKHVAEFVRSFSADLAFAFVIWDQARQQRKGARP